MVEASNAGAPAAVVLLRPAATYTQDASRGHTNVSRGQYAHRSRQRGGTLKNFFRKRSKRPRERGDSSSGEKSSLPAWVCAATVRP